MRQPGMLPYCTKFRLWRAERGVSLIELMIAMALGLLVMSAMTAVFVNNSQARRELDKAAQQLENGRYAMQILKDEISLAGFYDTLAAVEVTPSSTSANPCSQNLAVWRASMDVALEGVNAGSFACITSAKENTGMLFVQRASTAETALTSLTANVAYLQVSLCGTEYASALTRYKLENPGAGVFNLKQIDCKVTLAPIRQYVRRIFFIDQNNVAGDGIPTLKRVDFGAGQALGTPVALVEGIDDMHFAYALDTDGNGSPDSFSEAPAPNQRVNIVGVRIWLIARAIDSTAGYTDKKTYQLGTKAAIQPNDSFKRHVFNSYIDLVHPVARRTK